MSETHVVVGAGGVGTALAQQLAEAGKKVMVITRSGRGPKHSLITNVRADASSVSALLAAAPESAAIYNCVNPPHYNKWAAEWPPLASAFLSYAEKTGAVLVTCSNLYGYGPTSGPLTEDLPLNGTWINSRVRADMWREAKRLHDEGVIRATEVRGSDYLLPGMQGRFGDRVVPVLKAGTQVQLLGEIDQLHTWTAPADVAALMRIVAVDERAWGKAWHVPSNAPKTQREVVIDIAAALGINNPRVSSVPKPVVGLLRLVNPLIRELTNGNYMFDAPFIMDDTAARKTFKVAPTPWDVVIRDLVTAYK